MARAPKTSLVVASVAGAILLSGCSLVPTSVTTSVPPGGQPGQAVPGGADRDAGVPGDHGMDLAYTPDPSEAYADHEFEALGVVIPLPMSWFAVEGELARVEGGSGFVHLTPADSGTGDVRDLCAAEADHKFQPWGSTPTVTLIEVDGQVGCRIDPSADQMTEGNYAGAIILASPRPILVAGVHYPMLVIVVDLGHLDAVQAGLRFT